MSKFDPDAFGIKVVDAVKTHVDRQFTELKSAFDTQLSSVTGEIGEIKGRLASLPTQDSTSKLIMLEIEPRLTGLSEKLAGVEKATNAITSFDEGRVTEMIGEAFKGLPELPEIEEIDPEIVKDLVLGDLRSEIDGLTGKVEGFCDEKRIDEAVAKAVSELPPAKNGKDADPDVIKSMVEEAVKGPLERVDESQVSLSKTVEDAVSGLSEGVEATIKAQISEIEPPKDGKSVEMDEVLPEIDRLVAEKVAEIELPKGEDGTSVTKEEVLPEIAAMVEEQVKAIPAPKDGTSVEVKDVLPEIERLVDDRVSKIPPAKDGEDGTSLKDLMINEDGVLVGALSTGEFKQIGRVRGDKGDPGKDGLGFDDLHFEMVDDRNAKMVFRKGSDSKEFGLAIPGFVHTGNYSDVKEYVKGDVVSHGGNSWFSLKSGRLGKPGESGDWYLGVKKGRQGNPGDSIKMTDLSQEMQALIAAGRKALRDKE